MKGRYPLRGADIVYSPDESVWYASMWEQETAAAFPLEYSDGDCPDFTQKLDAEQWAMKRGAKILLYP